MVSASLCASSRNTSLRDDSDGTMDPKYEFRYTANANNAARAASLTGRGPLNI